MTDEDSIETALREPLIVSDDDIDDGSNYHRLLWSTTSNFSTSFNVVNISLVLPILENQINETKDTEASMVASSLLAGMIVGQIVGGTLGDIWGVEKSLRMVILLQVVASLGSSAVHTSSAYEGLSVWRFVLGIGAGGVYPLAAVLAASNGYSSSSIHQVVQTFSVQGLGFLSVPLLGAPLLYSSLPLDYVWRILLAAGAVPGFVLFALSFREARTGTQPTVDALPESPTQETRSAFEGQPEALEDSDGEEGTILDSTLDLQYNHDSETGGSSMTVIRHGWLGSLKHEHHWQRKFIGTAGTWFLFDIVFYGNTIFEPLVLEAAFHQTKVEGRAVLQQAALDSLYVAMLALPGYIVAYSVLGSKSSKWCCCPEQTPKYVMLQGFALMAILYILIGISWHRLQEYPVLLIVLYGSTFFFSNYGPNTTTFLLPSLVYSEECRSTWNGLSAAFGKFGAYIGALLFAPAADKYGDNVVLLGCGGLALVAWLLTKLFVGNHRSHHDGLSPDAIGDNEILPSNEEVLTDARADGSTTLE